MSEIKSECEIITTNDIKVSKNRKKLERRKRAKLRKQLEIKREELSNITDTLEVSYPTELHDIEEFDLTGGFERFKLELKESNENIKNENCQKLPENLPKKAVTAAILQDEDDEEDKPISRKQWKKLNRMTIGQLKCKVKDPKLVEPYDNCSPDPMFLLELKRHRNTVPVPAHWCHKGRYLQSKRGFYKPPFKLPDYIANTGIMDIRPTNVEDNKNLKQKMKEKIRPRTGVFELSYGKLYQAFFELQTKPKYTILGEIYYQGKELESECKFMRPGYLSDPLREALGMPPNNPPSNAKVPPPYLIQQQRYGPPHSWPKLKIPGLNAQLPPGASYGYHKDGWGKPPVDENNKPLYGEEVFKSSFLSFADKYKYSDEENEEDENKKLWGGFDSDEEEEVEKNESDAEEEEVEPLEEMNPIIPPQEVNLAQARAREIEEGEVSDDEEEIDDASRKNRSTEASRGSSRVANSGHHNSHQRKPYLELKTKEIEGKNNKDIITSRVVYDIKKDVENNNSVGDETSTTDGANTTSSVKRKNTSDPAYIKAKKHKSFKF